MITIQKKCFISVVALLCLFSANHVTVHVASAQSRSVSAPMASTFRIRSETSRGNIIITGHGTAFGINLSEYGYNRPRYLMTACHVIREHDGSICRDLKLEIRHNGGVRWVPCRVLASDPKMDVAVVECEIDLPQCARFAAHNAMERAQLTMIGSPAGVPLKAVNGYVTSNKRIEPSRAYVDYIHEGCSGGPIFDSNSQRVVGLVIAGIGAGKSGQMDPHTCLYVSLSNMQRFLRLVLKSRGDGYAAQRNNPRYVARVEPEIEYEPQQRRNSPCHRSECASSSIDRSGVWLP